MAFTGVISPESVLPIYAPRPLPFLNENLPILAVVFSGFFGLMYVDYPNLDMPAGVMCFFWLPGVASKADCLRAFADAFS